MSTVFATAELLQERGLLPLCLAPTKGDVLIPLLISSSRHCCLSSLLLIDSPGASFAHDGEEYVGNGPLSGRGHCGLVRIENSFTRKKAGAYHRTLLKCTVPGCLAEYEYRVSALDGDLRPEMERVGVLLVRPPKYPTAQGVSDTNKPYGQFGQFHEHRHFSDAVVPAVPLALSGRLESFLTDSAGHPSVSQVVEGVLDGISAIRSIVVDKLRDLAARSLRARRKRSREVSDSTSEPGSPTRNLRSPPMNVAADPLMPLTPFDSPPSNEQLATDYLKKYRLRYVPEHCVMFCGECDYYVGPNFEKHSLRIHSFQLDSAMVRLAKSMFTLQSFVFPTVTVGQGIDPLPYLPIKQGFACSECNYCLSDQWHITDHIKKTHENIGRAEPCSIQRPLDNRGPLIRVRSQEPEPLAVADNAMEAFAELQVLMSQQVDLQPDNENTSSPLYNDLGWFGPVETELLQRLNARSFMQAAIQGFDFHPIASEILQSVKRAKMLVRNGFRNNHANYAAVLHPISEESIRRYAQTGSDFISFLINLSTRAPPEIPTYPLDVAEVQRNPTKRNILALILQCIDHKVTDLSANDFFELFIKFGCLRQDGALAHPQDFAQRCSNLLYFMKSSILCQHMDALDANEPHNFDHHFNMMENDTPDFRLFAVRSLMQLLNRAKDIIRVQMSPSNIQVIEDGKHFIVHKVEVRNTDIGKAYQYGMEKIRNLIKILSLGVTADLETVKESPHDKALGVSLSMQNPKFGQRILQKIFSGPLLHEWNHFEDGKYFTRLSRVEEYLRQHDDLVKWLVLVIHISSGMPARCTELETYRLVNSTHLQRSVMLFEKLIMLKTAYSKTNKYKDTIQPRFRFLPKELSGHVVQLEVVIRPLVTSLAKKFGKEHDHYVNLFAQSYGAMTAEDLRECFKTRFYWATNVSLNVSSYRHVVKYLTENDPLFQNGSQALLDKLNNSVKSLAQTTAAQFGHSELTSELKYGITDRSFHGVKEDTARKFKAVSVQWHCYIDKQNGRCSPAQSSFNNAVEFGQQDLLNLHVPVGTSSVKDQAVQVDDFEESAWNIPSSDSFNFSRHVSIPPFCDIHALEELRIIVGNPDARFKTSEQGQLADLLLHSNQHIMAVLPPAAGKTLLLLLTASYYRKRSGKIVVLLVPLIALKADVIRRCQEVNLTVCRNFADEEGAVMVLNFDEALNMRHQFLLNLGRIGRICIDEAHTLITDTAFRKDLERVFDVTNIGVPVTLLTGSAPRYVERSLKDRFFSNEACRTVRSCTQASNIEYNVLYYSSHSEVLSDLQTACLQLAVEDRIIVYFKKIQDLKKYHESVPGSTIYYSNLPAGEKESNERSWKAGVSKVLLSTSAYGVGMDFPKIRKVFLIDDPFTFEDYFQQCGRCARDGLPGNTFLYLPVGFRDFQEPRDHIVTEAVRESKRLLIQYCRNGEICRRRLLSQYFDGSSHTCFSMAAAVPCDICKNRVGYRARIPETFPVEPSGYTDWTSSTVDSQSVPRETQNSLLATSRISRAIALQQHHLTAALESLKGLLRLHCASCLGIGKIQPAGHSCAFKRLMETACYTCLNYMRPHHRREDCPLRLFRFEGMCYQCWYPWTTDHPVNCRAPSLKHFIFARFHFLNSENECFEDMLKDWYMEQVTAESTTTMKVAHRTCTEYLIALGHFGLAP